MQDINKFSKGISIKNPSGASPTEKGDISLDNSTGELTTHDGSSAQKIVTDTKTQTLTNKTLTAPTISTITNGGTVTVPSGIDTLVARTSTDTGSNRLKNKDLEADSTNIVNSANTGTRISFDLTGQAGGTAYTLTTTNSASVSLNLPNNSLTDTLVARNTTDTLTNKTISGSSNTLSDIPNSATTATSANTNSAIVARDSSGNFSAGTITATLSGNATNVSGVVAADHGGTGVANNAAATLTRSGNHALTLTTSNTTSLTLPTTGTLSTLSGTETLSNKTFSDAISSAEISTPSTPSSGFDKLYFKSDGNLYRLNSAGVENLVGSGSGSGSKNYITTNSSLESGTTSGYSLGTTGTLTNGLPTGTPTFGSGASGNLSISASNTSPLAGSYSLLYASSAATTVGNMVATDAIALDAEAQGNVLAFRFAYNASSGASNMNMSGTSSNSYGVALWDATNSAWIPLAGQFNFVQTSGVGYCSGTAQIPVTTTSVRLCIYNVNATAGAATLKIDDFFLGPQVVVAGFAGNDWNAYTPTTAGFGTISASAFYWRRVGDTVQLQGIFTSGVTTATQASISLPSGLLIDSAKLSVPGVVGSAYRNGAGTTNTDSVLASASIPGSIGFGSNQSPSTLVAFQLGNNLLANSETFSYFAQVPIAGWSSNTVMSNDTDTRVVSTKVSISSATAFTNDTPTIYSTVEYDTTGSYSTVTGLYTVPVSGKYHVSVFSVNNGAAGSNYRLWKNGVAGDYLSSSPGAASGYGGSTYINCAAGDTLSLRCVGTITTQALAGGYLNYATFTRVSGPATIAATESVNARYSASSTSLTSGANTTIVYTTKDKDTHNAYNTATGIFTAPVSGMYEVTASMVINTGTWGTVGGSNSVTLGAAKNGTSVQTNMERRPYTAEPYPSVLYTDQVYCLAGDTIRIQGSQTNSSATTLSVFNATTLAWVTFKRVGN